MIKNIGLNHDILMIFDLSQIIFYNIWSDLHFSYPITILTMETTTIS